MWGIFIYMDITSFGVDCFISKNESAQDGSANVCFPIL